MTKGLVTGVTGNVGLQAIRELRSRDLSVCAFVRDTARAAEKLGDNVELASGDFSDTASLRPGGRRDAVFLACTNDPRQVEYETGVIDAGRWARRSLKSRPTRRLV